MKKSIIRRNGKSRTAGRVLCASAVIALAVTTAGIASPVDGYLDDYDYDYEVVEEESVHSEFDDVSMYAETERDESADEQAGETEDVRALFNTGLIEEADEPVPAEQEKTTEKEETRVHTEGESEGSKLRDEMIEFARQFIGNPYVWGGTSLTDGADCSGFCLSVYAHFGITIPRVACDQAAAGERIPLSEAQPGDLVFYADGSGYVYHAAMCSGPGTTVQAQNSRVGIVETGMNGASFACRYFD